MRFFVGLHQPSDARHVDACCVSVNRLRKRVSFPVSDWLMDSGAFTEILTHGGYRHSVEAYASEVKRWAGVGRLLAAATQDFMCEPFILQRTGLTVADHQRLTIERFDALRRCDTGGVSVLPVLQGYQPHEYARHVRQYGERLAPGAWVGVGSVCKRNASPESIVAVLLSIKSERPDLRLHGFGLKQTALADPRVVGLLASADSMAWSFAARKEGRNANDWREAVSYCKRVIGAPAQLSFYGVAS